MTTLPAASLLKVLQLAEKFSHQHEKAVRLEFKDRLEVTANGDVIRSKHTLPYVGDQIPAFGIQRKDFSKVLTGCGEAVSVEMEGTRLHVGKGKAKYRLDTMSGSEVAEFSDVEAEEPLAMSGAEWAERLAPVTATMGSDINKPHMMGVLFDEERVVSSDGFRFTLLDLPVVKAPLFIHRAAVEFVLALARADHEAVIGVAKAGSGLRITSDNVVAKAPGVPGQLVYKPIMPAEQPIWTLQASAGELLQAIRQVTVLSGGKTAPIILAPQESGVLLKVGGDGGEAEAELAAAVTGTMPPVKLNWSYLEDAMTALDPEKPVVVEAANPLRPVAIRGTSRLGCPLTSLVMALR